MSAEILRASVTGRVGGFGIDAEFDTAAGTLVVVGPNGAGKTSLLSLLLGLQPVERGSVVVGETVLLDTSTGVDLPVERRGMGYVPQDYALFPHLSVRGNLEFAVRSAMPSASRGERASRIEAMLSELGLCGLAERRPGSLSGGEKQRVALARALSAGPRALFLDEPLAALDVHSRREVRGFLARTLTRLELPTVIVTHDAIDARLLGRRIAVLEGGRFTQMGTWDELVARPASAFVAELVSR